MDGEKEKPVLQEITRKVERNVDGTLKKGSTANPNGRPPKRKIEDYITENDVVNIVEKAREEALKGKPDLLKELLGYMFGKPKQGIELTGEDGQPISLEFRKNADKSIKDYLNENSRDIKKQQPETDKSSVSVQQGKWQ